MGEIPALYSEETEQHQNIHDCHEAFEGGAFGSKKTFQLDCIVAEPNSRNLYCLKQGSNCSFISEELMLVPVDVEIHPYHVKEW